MPADIHQLSKLEPFSKGGNRLCFISPENPDICLKVHQSHRTPELRRSRKSFPANLRPLSIFDENLQEHLSLTKHHKYFPQIITQHLPETFGMVATDLGYAHAMELIRDDSGLISETLELYIWNNGLDQRISQTLETFKENWISNPPRSSHLLPHNLVVRHKDGKSTILIIDGYSRNPRIPLLGGASASKARSRLQNLDLRIQEVLDRKKNNDPKERLQNLRRDIKN